MSGKQGKSSNLFPDGSQKLSEEDKCGLYESSRTDSGFLSGGNLIVSGEITSEEQPQDSGPVEDETSPEKSYMHIDSGVDFCETFSNLSLKHPDLNDLNSKGLKEIAVAKQPVRTEEDPWDIYFQQDEDGDT